MLSNKRQSDNKNSPHQDPPHRYPALSRPKIRAYSTPQLKHATDSQLLQLYAAVMEELRERGVVRSSNNPVSDYAEKIIAARLNLTLVRGSNRGFDAQDSNGTRYQIKARRNTRHNRSRQLGVIRDLDSKDFDYLLAGIFDESFNLKELWKIPHERIKVHARYGKHQNGHILHLRGAVLKDHLVSSLLDSSRSVAP